MDEEQSTLSSLEVHVETTRAVNRDGVAVVGQTTSFYDCFCVMDGILKVLYCESDLNHRPDWSFEALSALEKGIQLLGYIFTVMDLVNFLLDVIFLLNILFSSNIFRGIMLLLAMILAKLVSRRGKLLQYKEGFYWAPWFQDSVTYFANLSIEEARVSTALHCVLFTELAVFLFEDATFLNAFVFTDNLPESPYDVANLIFKTIKGFVAFALFIIALVYGLGKVPWCDEGCGSFICRMFRAFWFFIATLIMTTGVVNLVINSFQLAFGDRGGVINSSSWGICTANSNGSGCPATFFFGVIIFWIFALYFSVPIRRQAAELSE